MSKTFRPAEGYIEIKPLEKSKVILSEDKEFIDCGEVICVADSEHLYTKFNVHQGDIIFFEAYGCYVTTDEVDGQKHYLVPIDSKIIKGVYGE